MKLAVVLALAGLALLQAAAENPIDKIVTLLKDLKTNIEKDGKSEQASYDKYACWCEDTMSTYSKSITDTKDQLEETQNTVIKNKGDLGSHGAEISQLKKDIAANIEAQKEATAVREKEAKAYEKEKTETEGCIGALEQAIKVLTGAGTGKGFLETVKEAQLLSVVAGVRGVISMPEASSLLPANQLAVVKEFVDQPEAFVGERSGVVSAVQIAQNPFGDYAPQSTQIQGILKSMYDSFTSDLESANADEAEKQKSFEELMETKKQELETLESTLQTTERTQAEKQMTVAESKELIDDLEKSLEKDEAFFSNAKTVCQEKALEWATRSRYRTEEIHALAEAIGILDSDHAKKTFENATTTFLQISEIALTAPNAKISKAYSKLKKLATQTRSLSLAKLAVSLKTGGHFDKVIVEIDKLIQIMRDEEAEDIAHRDRCEAQQNDNKNKIEDLNHAIERTDTTISQLEDKESELKDKIKTIEEAMNATKEDIDELKTSRNEEHEAFLGSVKADTDAVALLEEALRTLRKYYKDEDFLLQKKTQRSIALHQQGGTHGQGNNLTEPEYSDAPPETNYEGTYTDHGEQAHGVISILEMLKEDIENEMKVASKEESESMNTYVENRNSLQGTLEQKAKSKAALGRQVAEVQEKIADANEFKDQKSADLEGEKSMTESIETDCDWVKTHFESRREKRNQEIDGLIEAKSYLAGGGEDVLS